MTRYLGLSEDDARQARDVLDGVVATRLKQLNGTGPIVVRFERPPTGSTVQVEVTSAALPGGDSPPAPEARGIGSTVKMDTPSCGCRGGSTKRADDGKGCGLRASGFGVCRTHAAKARVVECAAPFCIESRDGAKGPAARSR